MAASGGGGAEAGGRDSDGNSQRNVEREVSDISLSGFLFNRVSGPAGEPVPLMLPRALRSHVSGTAELHIR